MTPPALGIAQHYELQEGVVQCVARTVAPPTAPGFFGLCRAGVEHSFDLEYFGTRMEPWPDIDYVRGDLAFFDLFDILEWAYSNIRDYLMACSLEAFRLANGRIGTFGQALSPFGLGNMGRGTTHHEGAARTGCRQRTWMQILQWCGLSEWRLPSWAPSGRTTAARPGGPN